MKKFNLERALAGDKVITREGETVTQLVCFEDLYVCSDDCLVGVVAGHIQQWDKMVASLGEELAIVTTSSWHLLHMRVG